MQIEVRRAEYRDLETLREQYRHENPCQIIHDSILRRAMADPWLILVDGCVGGYGGVWNKYDVGRVMEYHTLPHLRSSAQPLFREFIAASGATSMEAQTNMPLMLLMFLDCVSEVRVENVLFADGGPTHLPCPKGVFRRSTPADFETDDRPDWVVEADGEIVANGGFLCHYNPPYGDVYMEVAEAHRRQGLGSYIVQEVKRVCYEAGKRPAARCNATNFASRRTLQKAGLLPCGRLLSGDFGER